MEILNVWNSTPQKPAFYNVGNAVLKMGDYSVYKQREDCYLYVFKNIGISQLAGLNKELLTSLSENKKPNNKNSFLFDRCNENLQRGLKLIENENIKFL